jgi:hypothetical protein
MKAGCEHARAWVLLLAAVLPWGCGRSVRSSTAPDAAAGASGRNNGAAGSSDEAPDAGTPRWVVENPSPLPNALYAAWASSESDLWVFGELGGAAHYDGAAWTVAPPVTSRTLQAAWGTGPHDVWAAGAVGTLVHFDGSGWSLFSAGSGTFSDIWGSASDDVWSVGDAVYHWDGTAWSEDAAATEIDLVKVRGLGERLFGISGHGELFAFDGSAWSKTVVPDEYATVSSDTKSTGVYAVAVTNEAVWFMFGSFDQTTNVSANQLVRWDDTGFQGFDVPQIGAIFHLNVVDGRPCLEAFRGIWCFDEPDFDLLGTTEYYDGRYPQSHYVQNLFALGGDQIWTVGSDSVVLRWDGATWTRLTSGALTTLVGEAEAGGRRLAFGPYDYYQRSTRPSLLAWDGAAWQQAPEQVPDVINAVWGTDSSAWAVTDSGLSRSDGGDWQTVQTAALSDVWGTIPGDIWTVGPSGVWRGDGSTFSQVTELTFDHPVRVAGSASDDVWVLGQAGAAYHFDGAAWSPFTVAVLDQNLFVAQTMTALSVLDRNDAWAAGDQVFAHWDGQSWSLLDPGTTAAWKGVHAVASDDVWAVGTAGAWHYDGQHFERVDVPTTRELQAVGQDSEGALWIVGEYGVILRRR